MSVSNNNKAPLRDRMIPWYFVMAFGVVFAVNGVFVYNATKTHSGLVTERAYEKGLDYDTLIAATERAKALGWQGTLRYTDGQLRYTLTDASGNAITGAKVVAHIARPTSDSHDAQVTLAESDAGYSAAHSFPASGQWRVILAITTAEEHIQLSERLVVR